MSPEQDADVPAFVTCAQCGLAECPGHSRSQNEELRTELPWESPLMAGQAPLLRTAELVTSEPALALSQLRPGSLSSALSFACAIELLAVTSLGAIAFALVSICFPGFAEAVLWTRRGIITTAASSAGFAALIVLLHVVWALAMELYLGLFFRRWQFHRSLRFSLYACGWDIWASPAGVLLGLHRFGRARTLDLCRGAARVAPRSALESYLTNERAVPPKLHRRAILSSMALSAPFVLFGVVLWLLATLSGFVPTWGH